jgi:hypothetical protein
MAEGNLHFLVPLFFIPFSFPLINREEERDSEKEKKRMT